MNNSTLCDFCDFFTESAAQTTILNFSNSQEIYSSTKGYTRLLRVNINGRDFVMKCLKASYRNNPFYIDLLRKEYDIANALSHPNVVNYYDFKKTVDYGHAILIEYIEGRTLRKMIDEERYDFATITNMISEICDGISYIHKKQVVHRNLKPENIMVSYMGNHIKIIDFGFADSESYFTLNRSATSRVYASSEEIESRQITDRSDIYAFGVLIDEIFKGKTPFKYKFILSRCKDKDSSQRYNYMEEVKKRYSILTNLSCYFYWIAAIALLAIALHMALRPALE